MNKKNVILILSHKKGVFFTLMSMLLIGLFVFALINPPRNVIGNERIQPITTRVQSLNDLVGTINNIYLDTIIETTTYNILNDIAIGDISIDVSLTATVIDEIEQDSDDKNNFIYWFDKVISATEMAYNSELELIYFKLLSVTQQDNEPFIVTVQYDINYTLNGDNPLLFWKIEEESKIAKISILNLADPDNGLELITLATYTQNDLGSSYLVKLGGIEVGANTKICPIIGC